MQLRAAVPDTEITASDFITAMKRTANPKANVGGYSFYYSVIKGFDDFTERQVGHDRGHDGGRRPHPADRAHRADG